MRFLPSCTNSSLEANTYGTAKAAVDSAAIRKERKKSMASLNLENWPSRETGCACDKTQSADCNDRSSELN